MSKVIELRKIVLTRLKTIHPRVFFMDAPDNAQYPYLIYNLPNSVDDGALENYVLDVDGWDSQEDTTALETLMSQADHALHRETVIVDGLSVTFYRENRLTLTDDNKKIRRRKYVYQARVYMGG